MSAATWTRNGPSGEDFLMLQPRLSAPARPPIIFCPQAGGQAEFFMDPHDPAKGERARLIHRLAREGWVCATSDFGGANTMGNDNATGRVKQVYDHLQTIPGVRPGAALMIGTSMGNATALSFARRYPNTVRGIVSIFGMSNAAPFYENDHGGFRNEFEAAWGVVYPAPLPVNADPMKYVGQLTGVSWRGWSSTDDGLVPPEHGAGFAAALRAAGGDAIHTTVPVGGHTDSIFASIPYDVLREELTKWSA